MHSMTAALGATRRARRPAQHGLPPGALALLLFVLVWALALAGCESRPEAIQPAASPPAQPAASPQGTPAVATPATQPTVLFLGDSLTAGFGLPADQAYPALLTERIQAAGGYRVVNAGVSGDTSAGGLNRLDWLLRQRVDVMVLALGANDGLRGLPVAALRANLAQIIEKARARKIRVVLAGIQIPANYGAAYTREFAAVYPALAEQYGLPLVPFLLEGVAMHPKLNLPDGIHPNEQGQQIVAANVWAVLEGVLRE